MKITFTKAADLKSPKGSNLVLAVGQQSAKKAENDFIKQAKNNYNFKGESGQICSLAGDSGLVIIVGIGEEKRFDELAAQKLGGKISSYLNGNKIKEATVAVGICINSKGELKYSKNSQLASNLAFGIRLQSYRFNKYFEDKKEGKDISIKILNFLVENEKEAKSNFQSLELITDNVFFARDLVSEPANNLNPESYAKICSSLSKYGLEVDILGEKEMKKLGMGALLGVGQGSAFESKLVVMKWNGAKNKKDQPIAFVGKGVTFDTGGISIKPSNNMEDMKSDMGGSAVVVGLMKLLAQRKAKVNAIGVVGLVENMPSSTAQRPGDVVKTMSGQTVEVINTDAEGRLVLGDALHYTNSKFKPKFIVDLATLTGAVIVALADVHAGLFSNDDKLSKQLEDAGRQTGETLWRLPVSSEYDQMINSDIADMKNVGNGSGAGSTTAAQFLHRFIGKTKWAHLDIAGVAWKGKGDPLAVKGATGFGVRLLNQLICDNYES